VGSLLVGSNDGLYVGNSVGVRVVGSNVGSRVGKGVGDVVVGIFVGEIVGNAVAEGLFVPCAWGGILFAAPRLKTTVAERKINTRRSIALCSDECAR
jgi:hypothetical protein